MDLESICILYREPDTLSLWGIPYDMRPGQQPADIADRAGWVWLGSPGWYGSMSPGEIEVVRAFRDRWLSAIPGGPNEWSRLVEWV